MFADALYPIISKKSVKENWKIIDNRKYYIKRLFQSTDHCKPTRDCRIKERIKIENSNKKTYILKNSLVLSFSIIIFLGLGDGLKSMKLIFSQKLILYLG